MYHVAIEIRDAKHKLSLPTTSSLKRPVELYESDKFTSRLLKEQQKKQEKNKTYTLHYFYSLQDGGYVKTNIYDIIFLVIKVIGHWPPSWFPLAIFG